MTQIKLIAIDLDGTLLTDDKQIPQENLQAIQEVVDAGIQVVVCTGRTRQGAERFYTQLPTSEDEYLIVQNGSLTYQLPDLQLMNAYSVDPAVAQSAYQALAKYQGQVQLVAFDQDHFYLIGSQEPSQLTLADSQTLQMPIHYLSEEEFLESDRLNKYMFIGESQWIDDLEANLPVDLKTSADPVRSQPFLLEILPQSVNKATALKALAQHLGLGPDQVMAIGDQLNDLEMLKWVDHSVAMGSGVATVKEACRHITLSNQEAGVAYALRNFVQ
ncbi:Cof-type HAD-IIB family hydrolase [Hutsoniella sourekii]|uniref:Cof-type HAD-IIB family hydrolase n=1 Tax=Hutsoniella sourekii TaxID=87650 RepID=UPI00048421CB|nr:Cof-type HAD-IIB family hydrolase [Hutsoniella sourekii]